MLIINTGYLLVAFVTYCCWVDNNTKFDEDFVVNIWCVIVAAPFVTSLGLLNNPRNKAIIEWRQTDCRTVLGLSYCVYQYDT